MTTQRLHCRLNDKAEATIAQLTHTDCRNRFFFSLNFYSFHFLTFLKIIMLLKM